MLKPPFYSDWSIFYIFPPVNGNASDRDGLPLPEPLHVNLRMSTIGR